MPFDATEGGESATSLCSETFADDYLEVERVGSESWFLLDSDAHQAALMQATRYLESKRWKGRATTYTQALSFPRYGIRKKNHTYYDSATVPDNIKKATAELAFLLTQDSNLLSGSKANKYVSVSIGDESATFRSTIANKMPPSVMDLLEDFILTTQARVLRA